MVHTDARFVIGVVGNIISGAIFLSRIPTFIQLWRKKDAEAFDLAPYLINMLNCLFWCYYGLPLVTPNNILVVTNNGFGLFMQLIYLIIYFYYAATNGRKRVAAYFVYELIFFGAVVAATVVMDRFWRAVVVGVMCFFSIAVMKAHLTAYCSPLCGVMDVTQMNRVQQYMKLSLFVAYVLNNCCWMSYALVGKLDFGILVCNGGIAIFGAFELIIYICMPEDDSNARDKVHPCTTV
ncbi:hypothetical protein ACLB2K_072369 [Fragaria x ananassa]